MSSGKTVTIWKKRNILAVKAHVSKARKLFKKFCKNIEQGQLNRKSSFKKGNLNQWGTYISNAGFFEGKYQIKATTDDAVGSCHKNVRNTQIPFLELVTKYYQSCISGQPKVNQDGDRLTLFSGFRLLLMIVTIQLCMKNARESIPDKAAKPELYSGVKCTLLLLDMSMLTPYFDHLLVTNTRR